MHIVSPGVSGLSNEPTASQGGDVAQEVRAVVWQSEGCRFDPHPGRVEVSLSKTPNPQLLLTSWLVPCMAANRRWCVNVCVNEGE